MYVRALFLYAKAFLQAIIMSGFHAANNKTNLCQVQRV